MKNAILIFIALFLLLPLYAQEEGIEGTGFATSADSDAAKQANDESYELRMQRHVPGSENSLIHIRLGLDDWASLNSETESNPVVGITKEVNVSVDLAEAMTAHSKRTVQTGTGVAHFDDKGFVWTAMLTSQGATGMRVSFKNVDLPEGAALYIYSDLGQVFGPYTGMGPNGKGAFWSDTLFAEVVWIQLETDWRTDPSKLAFTIDKMATFGNQFQLGAEYITYAKSKSCPANGSLGSCFENAKCYDSDTLVDHLMDAVAWILFQSDSDDKWYGCTGGLINGQNATSDYNWFLTAAHCINSSTEADSMEAYFDYHTSSCSSLSSGCNAAFSGAHKVSGATLRTTNSAANADYSLLELSSMPSGSWWKLGWTSSDYSDNDGDVLYRVSHPLHYPQAYSEHTVSTSASACEYDRPTYIYTYHTLGYTEGGSSGAPLVNGSGKIVGTDRGRCNDVQCQDTVAMRDGSFHYQYWDRLRPFLNPSDIHVEDIQVSVNKSGIFYQPKVRVRVLDSSDVPVAGAFVQIHLTGPGNMALFGATGYDGWATILGFPVAANGTWTACTQIVIHEWLNWDSSEDVESCDSN